MVAEAATDDMCSHAMVRIPSLPERLQSMGGLLDWPHERVSQHAIDASALAQLLNRATGDLCGVLFPAQGSIRLTTPFHGRRSLHEHPS